MRITLIVMAQWFFSTLAVFSFITGWVAIAAGNGGFIALFGVLFAVGFAGFLWFTSMFSKEINSYY